MQLVIRRLNEVHAQFTQYRQGWERQQVLDLFAVLDWMMSLPAALQQRLWQDVDEMDQEKRMAYVTTWEQRGIEKGIQAGIEKGMEKGLEVGLEQGQLLGQAALLERQLTRRFGPLPDELRSRLAAGSREQLQTWGDRVLDATTLAEVFSGH